MAKVYPDKINIFWFRRDLRLNDNAGLYYALKSGLPVLPVFIFDSEILDQLEDPDDARVMFIHGEISKIHNSLRKIKSGLLVKKGKPVKVFKELIENYHVNEIFCNHDYEPYAIERDGLIKNILKHRKIAFSTFKDQVIFEKKEILNNQGEPYKIFTPYKNKWLSSFSEKNISPFPSEKSLAHMIIPGPKTMPTLDDIGFRKSSVSIPSKKVDLNIIRFYDKHRDFPAQNGTSRLGIHLRHGTMSIREAVRIAMKFNDTWLNELIWREFYMMILFHFPMVVNNPFKPHNGRIHWDNNEENFVKWCHGYTGFTIVDAGMRQLNETGYMHNRVRMIVASFLTKHLLIDWRWGEAYFARKLLDYELASNNGGWQWAAGTGTDAQPYFRVFNPYVQTKKFDPKLMYVRKWVPEFDTGKYPNPMIDHIFARKRAIEIYKNALHQ